MNFKLIAIQVGELIKYDSSLKEINRAGAAVFNFSAENFPPVDGISSERAKLLYNWIMTLFKQQGISDQQKLDQLYQFCLAVTREPQRPDLEKIFKTAGAKMPENTEDTAFLMRNLHSEVHKHSKKLFNQKNYFHAVFESAKAYNSAVKIKSNSTKDGQDLMLSVWGSEKGVLKVNTGKTDSEKNVQDGLKFLSAGLMSAIRNPTAHEPALDWPINKEDALDILNFISYLYRQLDKATYYNGQI